MQKDLRKIHRRLTKLGYTIKMANSGHWKLYDGDRYMLTMSGSASCHHMLANVQADLRRLGINLKEKVA